MKDYIIKLNEKDLLIIDKALSEQYSGNDMMERLLESRNRRNKDLASKIATQIMEQIDEE